MTDPETAHPRDLRCRVCGALAVAAGSVQGRFLHREYSLARCPDCGFGFVSDPTVDFAQLYDERYYEGKGADPLVDYSFELAQPARTIRVYEWDGIAKVVRDLIGPRPSVRWIDFGCGNGGLVRHLRSRLDVDAIGFEDGSITDLARAAGIPVHTTAELPAHRGTADVVTAIEVLEHTLDPVAELRKMRDLLKPGGLLFLTTGNLERHVHRFEKWRYVVPEIHISFFEPRTIERAMELAGLRSAHPALGPGFDSILKYKVLKNLRIRRRTILTDVVPKRPLGIMAETTEHLGDHPVGWAV